jgi:hypothetical protein
VLDFVVVPSIIVDHFVPSDEVSHLKVYEVGEVSTMVYRELNAWPSM